MAHFFTQSLLLEEDFAIVRRMEPIKIDKMVFGGQGMGRLEDGHIAFVWNALPGEEVEMEVLKKKRGFREGIARSILTASPDRIDPVEPGSYLSTSPWQMMTFEAEQRYKVEMAKEALQKLGHIETATLPIVGDEQAMYGYRNKMEFSFFTETRDTPMQLCFYARGSHQKVAVEGSALAEPIINEVAHKVLDWLIAQEVNRLDLKTLIVRSDGQGQAIAALFVKEALDVDVYPELSDTFKGFQIYFSNPKSPASVPTDLLFSCGDDSLVVDLNGVQLQCGLLSFFQVNQPIFAKTLTAIQEYLGPNQEIVDVYSGVGSIGLCLASSAKSVTLVENNAEACEYTRQNVSRNKIKNATVVEAAAEHVVEEIVGDRVIILDPPRAGVHGDVIDRLLEVLPPKIVYLSCNISTQARDIQLLLGSYRVVSGSLYNYFPRTPHVESLMFLERI